MTASHSPTVVSILLKTLLTTLPLQYIEDFLVRKMIVYSLDAEEGTS